jgi:hypothetical protein
MLCFCRFRRGFGVAVRRRLLSHSISKLQECPAGLQVLAGWLCGAACAHDERHVAARSCQQQPSSSPAHLQATLRARTCLCSTAASLLQCLSLCRCVSGCGAAVRVCGLRNQLTGRPYALQHSVSACDFVVTIVFCPVDMLTAVYHIMHAQALLRVRCDAEHAARCRCLRKLWEC